MVRCRIMHISPKQTTKKININLCNATLNNEMIYPHQLTHSPPYNRLKQNWRKINQHTKNTKSFRFLAVLLTDNYVVCSCIIRYLIADVMSIGCDESKGIAVAVCLFRFVCVRIFFFVNDSSCNHNTIIRKEWSFLSVVCAKVNRKKQKIVNSFLAKES